MHCITIVIEAAFHEEFLFTNGMSSFSIGALKGVSDSFEKMKMSFVRVEDDPGRCEEVKKSGY